MGVDSEIAPNLVLVKSLLLDKMREDKVAELRAYFRRRLPSPDWVEELLDGLSKTPYVENVLKLIRNDPSQTTRHGTTLSVGLYLVRRGISVEFMDTEESRSFDLSAGDAADVEVKHLDDVSNWTPLSRRILEIPSRYLVTVATDIELSPRQVEQIVAEIRAAVAAHSEPAFDLSTASADYHFIKVSSERTLPMVSSRTFGVDLPGLRRLFASRIEDAKGQLGNSKHLKIVAIDIDRSKFFTDSIWDVFCGSPEWRFTKLEFKFVGGYRKTDGLLNEPDLWRGIDGLLVFHGYDRGARRIAYFQSPNAAASQFPAELGKPDSCS